MRARAMPRLAALGPALGLVLAPVSAPAAAQRPPYIPKAVELSGANPAEAAALAVWSLRAALNVAAIQCQFSPFLRAVPTYNSLLKQHAGEFMAAQSVLGRHFTRIKGKGKAGATAFDQFNTRLWQSYSTLDAQRPFCAAAARAGYATLVTPIGKLGEAASERVGAVRASLTPLAETLGRTEALAVPASGHNLECAAGRGRC